MNKYTYMTLRKIAADNDEPSWWDTNGHKVIQAAIPGIGVWGLGRLLGLDSGIAAALGLGSAAVGWNSGDWAKDWITGKKKEDKQDPNKNNNEYSGYESVWGGGENDQTYLDQHSDPNPQGAEYALDPSSFWDQYEDIYQVSGTGQEIPADGAPTPQTHK